MNTNQSTAAYSAVITSDPRKSRMKRLRKYRPLYLLALPAIVYLIVNNYFPMAGLILAFKNYSYSKGIFGSEWCGLKNFTYLFGSKWAGIMFRNTILYNLVFIFLGTLIAVVVAILLSEVRSARAQKLYQVIILIPYLMSTVLIGYLVFAFFSSDNGFINNSILKTLGLDPVKWYMKPDAWPGILIFVQMWRSFGFQSIVFFATILGFDKTLYESAVMDGASTWQQITKITLPLLKPTIIILIIMSLGRMFSTDFGLFYQVPQNTGMLYEATTTIDTFVYRTLMEDHDVGRALAAGFLQSVLGFFVIMIANTIVRKVEPDSALF